MLELLNEAFSPANVVITGLLIFMLFYWCFVLLGVVDAEFLNIDLDFDVDPDIDIDADMDTDLAGGGSWAIGALHFLNIGTIPFALYLSILFLSMWVCSILTHYYLGDANSWLTALAFFLPTLLVGLIATKVITQPFLGIFKNLKSSIAEEIDFQGEVAEITVATTPNKMGQAELTLNGDYFMLNVKAAKGYLFSRGEQVVIASYIEKEQLYIVSPLKEL